MKKLDKDNEMMPDTLGMPQVMTAASEGGAQGHGACASFALPFHHTLRLVLSYCLY